MARGRLLSPANVAGHVVLAAIWALVLASGSASVAFVYFLASRALYVSFVGFSLRAQDETGWWTRRWGAEEGFERFKFACTFIMHNDAVSIGMVCWSSRMSLGDSVPLGVLEAIRLDQQTIPMETAS